MNRSSFFRGVPVCLLVACKAAVVSPVSEPTTGMPVAPYCVAHRGQTSSTDETVVAQENTWLNIERAVCEAERHGVIPRHDMGCEGRAFDGEPAVLSRGDRPLYAIEFDVWHTADGVALLSHGHGDLSSKIETLAVDAGSCPIEQRVSQVTWQQLSETCKPKHAAAGSDMTVLRLDWVLDQLHERNPHAVPVVELKDAPQQATFDTLTRYVTAHPGALRVISFQASALHALLPAVTPRQDYEIYLLDANQVPPPEARQPFDGIDISQRIAWDYPDLSGQRMIVGTWTANDRDTMTQVVRRGVDFITTDEPALCFEVVRGG